MHSLNPVCLLRHVCAIRYAVSPYTNTNITKRRGRENSILASYPRGAGFKYVSRNLLFWPKLLVDLVRSLDNIHLHNYSQRKFGRILCRPMSDTLHEAQESSQVQFIVIYGSHYHMRLSVKYLPILLLFDEIKG